VDKAKVSALTDGVGSGLVVLYATASGNAEELAHATAARLRAAGHDPVVANVADFSVVRLRDCACALLLVSTWGEGAPPPDAEEFCAELARGAVADLSHLRFAVLALGSSMYPDFCACGRGVDADLARAGAKRLVARVDCDTKYRAEFEHWLDAVASALAPR
jgi:sulfite reductase alpha subunit-like flavoprotein